MIVILIKLFKLDNDVDGGYLAAINRAVKFSLDVLKNGRFSWDSNNYTKMV